MKADNRRVVLDYLEEILLAGINTKVAAVRPSYPGESIPDIKAVYRDEEDYDMVKEFPCLVLFSYGPDVLEGMGQPAYLYEYPVDVIAVDTPKADDGLPGLYNRLYIYQGCYTDLLLTDYGYAQGYWMGVRPMEPVDPESLVDERFGSISRLAGYRFGFQVALSYI